MAKSSIESRKSEIKTISDRTKSTQTRLEQLESAKAKALEERTVFENTKDNMEEDAARELEQASNAALENISAEGKDLSQKMDADMKKMDEIKAETSEALDADKTAKAAEERLVSACKDNNIVVPESKALPKNIAENESLLQAITEQESTASSIATRLGLL